MSNIPESSIPATGLQPALARKAVSRAALRSASRAAMPLGCLILGYIGVYLCRKNFSVAVPLIQTAFHTDKTHLGAVESYAMLGYVCGKLFWGPNFVDRYGGRRCFFIVLLGVALFGGVSAFAFSLPMLGACYLANRFFGAGGWACMVKLGADWFSSGHVALVMACLCLSIVFGSAGALLLAGQIASASGNNWHAVLGIPSLVLLGIMGICLLALPTDKKEPGDPNLSSPPWTYHGLFALVKMPRLWILCCLSFTLTITRETFSFWTADFFKTEGGAHATLQQAALLSIPFDAMGAVGIIVLGWLLDRVTRHQRNWILCSILMCVAVATYFLPALVHGSLWLAMADMGLIGLLAYGPYCLPSGAFAFEVRGKEYVASVAGLVDAAGYLAGILSGYVFGRILDVGGYSLGFHCLALTSVIGALICLGLNRTAPVPNQQN